MRRPLILAAAALAVASLSGCATAAGNTTATTVVTAAGGGPVTKSTATPAAFTSAAPALANTGTNWPTIVTSLTAYGQWLLANPNPALVGTIATPGCGTAGDLTGELQSLVDQGAYVKTTAPVFTSVAGLSTATATGTTTTVGSQVTVDVQVSQVAEPVLDRKNAKTTLVLSTLPQLPSTALRITLLRGTDNRWRFCDVTAVLADPDGKASTLLF